MKPAPRSPNHGLTRDEYVLMAARGRGRLLVIFAAVLILLGTAITSLRLFENHLAPATYLSDVRAENVELRKEVTKLRFDLELELATRNELERQVASLTDQLKKVSDELAFLKAAGARPGK